METGSSWNRPRMAMATSCRPRSLTGASTWLLRRAPTNLGTRGALTATGSRHRDGISIKDEQRQVRRLSDEHRCRRMTVGGVRARATVSASPGRGDRCGPGPGPP